MTASQSSFSLAVTQLLCFCGTKLYRSGLNNDYLLAFKCSHVPVQGQCLCGDLHLPDAAKEICDQNVLRVPLEQVGAVPRGGHTQAFWTDLKLETKMDNHILSLIQQSLHKPSKTELLLER